jgi:signal transduction histidine kinase
VSIRGVSPTILLLAILVLAVIVAVSVRAIPLGWAALGLAVAFALVSVDRMLVSARRLEKVRRAAIDEARREMSDELHDTHVQNLTALDFQIEAILAQPTISEPARAELRKMRELARQSVVQLRTFLSAGHADASDDFEEIIARSTKNWKGEFVTQVDEGARLTRESWAAIEVMIREGLSNAKKHARADWAMFKLERADGVYVATLHTNGRSPELPVKEHGYGLTRLSAAMGPTALEFVLAARAEGGASLSAIFPESA